MTPAGLRTLTIENFRSIRGSAVIPLESPVVLLHGTNGAGKSTVMSALALALAGDASGIEPVDPSHLVHRGAKRARIDLTTADSTIAFAIEGSKIVGEPLLAADDGRFFAERCYLQQRTLGRMLELYQEPAGGEDSPLTAFVNELLGLDELDALIAGLYPVLHKARVRRLVPDYAAAEREETESRADVARLQGEIREAQAAVAASRQDLVNRLAELEASPALEGDTDAAAVWLSDLRAAGERALVDLLATRRELAALAARARSVAQQSGAADLAALEQAAAAARQAADRWRAEHGAPLDALLDTLRERYPGIPAVGGARDPSAVRAAALELVTAEMKLLEASLQTDERTRQEIERLEEMVAQARTRVEALREQLAEAPPPTVEEQLAAALAALMPHIHTDECPVCGRDYSEIGDEPLAARLARRVSELSARAEHLQELASASSAALADLTDAERRRDDALGQRMDPHAKVTAQADLALLADAQRQLVAMATDVAAGAELLRAQTEAERDLAMARDRDAAVADLRRAVEAQAAALGQSPPAPATAATDAVAELAGHVAARIDDLERRGAAAAEATEAVGALREALAAPADLRLELADAQEEHQRMVAAINALDARRKVMRTVHDAAVGARTEIVQRVFTNSLNRTWRDLFIRLAPEEPFVPAFRVPDASERVVAVLETVHRDGKPGGPPAAMLSAGNLNTAALTLFLALNLSVERRLPWILLDDPVQSMDEVHVSQFAALLRTLTREHGRRVMMAVHERALFEYLALELSPATKDEALQTVELTRGPDGSTKAEPEYQGYVEDRAFEVA